MGLSASSIIEVGSGGSDTLCSGGFNPANANFATDLQVVSGGNTASPVVSSASYTFVAGDVNAYLFPKTGGSIFPGWYRIASVASGQATLDASIGAVILYQNGGIGGLNTSVGMVATSTTSAVVTWGCDRSQQDTANLTGTNLAIDATTNTKVTTATRSLTPADVGNFLQITTVGTGTGATVGNYEILSVASGAATLDRAAGGTGTTAITFALGGRFATLVKVAPIYVAGNTIFAKGTLASLTSGLTFSTAAGVGVITNIIGYSSNRLDGGKATLITSTTSLTLLTLSGTGIRLRNFVIDANNTTSSTCLSITAPVTVDNVTIKNFTNRGISNGGNHASVSRAWITGGTSAAAAGYDGQSRNSIHNSVITLNSCPGLKMTNSTLVDNCIIANNSGSSSDGVQVAAATATNSLAALRNCTIANNGRDGIRATVAGGFDQCSMVGNLISSNLGYGINSTTTTYNQVGADSGFNAFYNNSFGARVGVLPFPSDFTLSGDPFVDTTTGNYALNSTSGAGASCRAMGYPGLFPNATTTGYRDVGAAQHQDSGSSASPNMGIRTGGRL